MVCQFFTNKKQIRISLYLVGSVGKIFIYIFCASFTMELHHCFIWGFQYVLQFFFYTPFSIWMVFKEPKKLNGEHVVKAWAKKMSFNLHPIFFKLLKLQCYPNLNWSKASKRMVQKNLTGCINVLLKYLFFESNELKNK